MCEIITRFIEKCNENEISVYNGFVTEGDSFSITLYNPDDLLNYCLQNKINSLVMEKTYRDPEDNSRYDKDTIIMKITDFFNKRKTECPYSIIPDNLPEDYYNKALDQVVEEIENDPLLEDSDQSSKNAEMEEQLESVSFYAFQPGYLISATFDLYSDDDDSMDGDIMSEKDILKKYAKLLIENMKKCHAESRKESERIRKENESVVLQEIEKEVSGNANLIHLRTQKARNEYADRIYAIWYREKGHTWLTKSSVRSIVDLQYVYVTGGKA